MKRGGGRTELDDMKKITQRLVHGEGKKTEQKNGHDASELREKDNQAKKNHYTCTKGKTSQRTSAERKRGIPK